MNRKKLIWCEVHKVCSCHKLEDCTFEQARSAKEGKCKATDHSSIKDKEDNGKFRTKKAKDKDDRESLLNYFFPQLERKEWCHQG
eukprot:4592972-Ditylum_brightwellii.AAC.1